MLRAPLLIGSVVVSAVLLLFSSGGAPYRPTLSSATVLEALQTAPEAEVIIYLKDVPLPRPGALTPETLEAYKAQVAAAQDRVLGALAPSDFTLSQKYSVVPAVAGRITASGVHTLESDPDVVRLSGNTPLFPALGQSVSLIGATVVQASGVNGTGVNVAVLDSGIARAHQDLSGSIVGEECFANCPNNTNRQSGPGSASDDYGHGTHVSGIITSNGTSPGLAPGVAPGAGIFAYRVCSFAPVFNTGLCSPDSMLGALDHVLDITLFLNSYGLPPLTPLINMSIGDRNAWPAGTCSTEHPAFDSTLGNLRLFGVLAFVASGNGAQKEGISWPACSPAAVSVGAVYDADLGQRTWSACTDSSTAPDKVICFSNSSSALDLVAPGAGITSAWPASLPSPASCWDPIEGGLTCPGTSMAAPHAVGVAALLKQARPELTPDQIELRLKRTGRWIKDQFNDSDPLTFRWTPRVDARVALLGLDSSDYDRDGCSNQKEFGSNVSAGGLRNPLDFWDFYDVHTENGLNAGTHLEGAITIEDIAAVVGHFLQAGNPNIDVFSNASGPGYHPRFDRSQAGPNVWNTGPADGNIDIDDITSVASQFLHSC